MAHRVRSRLPAPALVLLLALAPAACHGEPPAEESVGGAVTIPPRVTHLENTFDSVYALGEAILNAIRDDDFETLWSYRVDEAEWYHIVWPQLPASRPGRNLPWDYAWRDLDQKSRSALLQTIAAHRGRSYRLVRVEFAGETTDYETYRVHRDTRCVVEGEDGEIQTLDLFGSVIERNGRFKAFSYVVD